MTELCFMGEVTLCFHANLTPLCKTTQENHVTKTPKSTAKKLCHLII